MAFLAVLLKDRRHVLAVGGTGRGFGNLGQRAADGLDSRALDLFAVQDRRDRIFELARRRIGVSLAAGSELVVDPPVIPDLAVGVDHERLGRDLGPELAGEQTVPVADDRKLQAEITRVRCTSLSLRSGSTHTPSHLTDLPGTNQPESRASGYSCWRSDIPSNRR